MLPTFNCIKIDKAIFPAELVQHQLYTQPLLLPPLVCSLAAFAVRASFQQGSRVFMQLFSDFLLSAAA